MNYFSLVCTCYGQQAKNISHFCGQSVSKEAKRMSPIKINTVMEATIQEPICSHKLGNRRPLNVFYSSTVCNSNAAWTSLPHLLNYQSKGRQSIVTLVFPQPPNAVYTKCIGKVKNRKPIYSFNHQAPQEAWTGHNISVEQMPGETVCRQHASSHLRNACVLALLIIIVLMFQVGVLKMFAFKE